ncbi:MAG: DUF4357 domain-containing protein [Clostridia bacterium]|nr:DUF4357 domain-containing protein [Clostridia bacterium]
MVKANKMLIPDGAYYIFDKKIKKSTRIDNGKFIVIKGNQCLECNKDWIPGSRKNAKIENSVLVEGVMGDFPSTAGWVALGNANNGWLTWKTEEKIN